MIKALTINQTPQDICKTLGFSAGTVITVQNKSTSTLRVTQSKTVPEADSQDCVYLMPYHSLTTEQGDETLWIWSPSVANIAVIKRS